jgi:cardiolipin synthase
VNPVNWTQGNSVRLLENGEEYYPRVFEAIDRAQKEVLIETFILFEDKIGKQLQAQLIAAAKRGAKVELVVDGYGSADFSAGFIEAMTAAGVRLHVYDPQPKFLGMRTNLFRRLHRKLVVVDGTRAFVSGMNFSYDHVRESGPSSKQDYGVEVEGPVVDDIRRLLLQANLPRERWRPWRWRRRGPALPRLKGHAGNADAMLVSRDNDVHRNDIERSYRAAIRRARHDIVIANAYFFPGFRLIRNLRDAAQRGVRVRLILQGNPDKPSVRWATTTLYDYLLRAGVKIYEYCERPLHGKVAVIDDDWATVGSSNLDPLSLYLNLEANLDVRDRAFAAHLRGRLELLMQHSCKELDPRQARRRTIWRQALSLLAFHMVRRFPAWAGWLPAHTPVRTVFAAERQPVAAAGDVKEKEAA